MVGKSYQWEDDPETSTFSFLEKGRVRLLNLSETGKERIVLYIESGCLFREVVLLHVSPLHPASLVALEPCEVYNFPRTLLDDAEFVRHYPALMSNLVHSLGAKAGAFYSQITESVELDPQTQVCRYLHRLAEERRTRVVNPGVSQSELALVLGLHRSTVCRIIRTLRDRGVLGHFTRCSLEHPRPRSPCGAVQSERGGKIGQPGGGNFRRVSTWFPPPWIYRLPTPFRGREAARRGIPFRDARTA